MPKCKLCKREMDIKGDLTSKDCGGDCLRCMAEIAEDPDCIKEMYKITGENKSPRELLKELFLEICKSLKIPEICDFLERFLERRKK